MSALFRQTELVTRRGLALHFKEEDVRVMGRTASGVRGIRLTKGDEVVAVLSFKDNEQLFLISEFGFAKRTDLENSTSHSRGTKGIIYYKAGEKTGELVGALCVSEKDELVCITSQGMTLKLKVDQIPVLGRSASKLKVDQIPVLGRSASGVRAVRVKEPDCLVGVARVVNEDAPDEK